MKLVKINAVRTSLPLAYHIQMLAPLVDLGTLLI